MTVEAQLADLLKVFSIEGPRYSTYPAVLQLSPEYNDKRYEIDLIRNNHANPGPLSIHVALPIWGAAGRGDASFRDPGHVRECQRAVLSEVGRTAVYVDRSRIVGQFHLGGGTSALEPDGLRELLETVRSKFSFAPDAEISAECDPASLNGSRIALLRGAGVNQCRFRMWDVLGPEGDAALLSAITAVREAGVETIVIDMPCGWPQQSSDEFRSSVARVLALRPDRITILGCGQFSAPEPVTAPSAREREHGAWRLLATAEMFEAGGYRQVGVDHVALAGDDLVRAFRAKQLHRNILGYSRHAGADLLGFGPSALTQFGSIYSRTHAALPVYLAAVNGGRFPVAGGYRMTVDDQIRRFVIMRIVCDLEVDKEEVRDLFGVRFGDYFGDVHHLLFDHLRHGLVIDEPNRFAVTDTGRIFVRNVASCFDAYVHRTSSESKVLTRTLERP